MAGHAEPLLEVKVLELELFQDADVVVSRFVVVDPFIVMEESLRVNVEELVKGPDEVG